ncbi:D-inositol-3-phosphate glycosyltransferase [Jonesia denitrificans]|uniref:D-inositol 3-phosphate glycosyltransferase n=1 Tax=Jonesia denitrificans (strain ATCC 14870 / DSM 20603 / BCRC 15368 / CIP 55.134 / JCM 11481 / NBRC 15587 / NCTC 10816 / Prevot 55134) TaxID=471856 RepID=MSHA_JONDD|nr:D-inositol-3-phosphate glycosyltransferase [Jonesia denitrificans]C7R101.1 RecName: Full=D-inositol 3-phosphate glycosyltransferase; AltName: Full=N-acetylglucosamine-inositol-phosphate N-acetylglucosaminyltransferase; Short=GlcNAc-Ins-P N-acetylglucosaminyltransferase [Jonesia denitrificans DSM 20603]ACV09725.1 UDP-N-acetylglucosamine [Jonesia denitrificans DSM 20603]ASE09063.1 D-inositol-3-phosphate glycosyltransferase [Jonesia denitrificans]QXB43609.1 D-inositol-3-phosphate glycosyltransf
MTVSHPAHRVAMLCVHTSPLAQPGTGDAGGMNVYVVELARAMAAQGTEVEIFTRRTTANQPDVVEVDDGVLVRHVTAGPYEGLDKNDLPGQLCYFTQGVLRTEAARQPGWYDIVHSHYWLSGQAGWLAADRWNVPLVHTMHTMARVKNAQLAPGDAPEPRARIIGEEQVVEQSAALVANTDKEAHELHTLYAADPEKVHVVAPGVDLAAFTPPIDDHQRQAERVALGLAPEGDVIVFAGRIQPLKGPDVLVDALALLRSQQPDRPMPTLVIIGGPSGRPAALGELRARVFQRGVAQHVRFVPPADRPTLAQWMRVADYVAMPSRNESFGLVAIEAQACGTPVIAADVGGLTTAVAHKKSGLLVPDHRPQTWAGVLQVALGDTQLRESLRAGARRHAQQFTWDHTATDMLAVYERTRVAASVNTG